MTEPTQAAKQRACDLANAQKYPEAFRYRPDNCVFGEMNASLTALAQLCQDISDAVEAYQEWRGPLVYSEPRADLDRFLLPKPAPDPLAEALRSFSGVPAWLSELDADLLRAALAQRGHEVAPIGGKG